METYIDQAEAARQLGQLRNRTYSRAYIHKLTKDPHHSLKIRMRGAKVCWEDIINLPSRKQFVGRPKKA